MESLKLRAVWAYATEAHKTQLMPSSDIPYSQHLGYLMLELMVAHTKAPLKNLELALAVAMLHDTIEDQGKRAEEIEFMFGNAIASGTQALTKPQNCSKIEAMQKSLEAIKQEPKEIWCVKLADRISNLGNIPLSWTPEKLAKYLVESDLILEALGEAHPYLQDRLAQQIHELRATLPSSLKQA